MPGYGVLLGCMGVSWGHLNVLKGAVDVALLMLRRVLACDETVSFF